MLYLRNTNQLNSLGGGVLRGPTPTPISSSVSASYTANSSSLFVILNDATTKLSTTASATTNFSAAVGSVVSASIAGTTPSSSIAISLFISASDASLYFTGSSTGSKVMTSFIVGSDVRYTISSSFNISASVTAGNAPGLFRTQYTPYFSGNPAFFDTAVSSSAGTADVGIIQTGFTSSVDDRSVQWLGYFQPATTETYTFDATADDAILMWIGNDAINNYTTASINMGSTSLGPNYVSGSPIALISGTQYPMRLQWGENLGGEYISMSFSTPTITKTLNFTGLTLYNTSSNGF
jgi:hypothetical protein